MDRQRDHDDSAPRSGSGNSTGSPSSPVRAVQYGVGPIGASIVRVAVERGYEFVGAIDVDPEKVGTDLGAAADLDRPLGVTVTDDVSAALDTDPDVVFHSTTSDVAAARPQLEEAMAAEADVISTCEALAYPWWHHPETASSLDEFAGDRGVTCLGTGINPGFAMDTLPAVLSTPCRDVERIRVERVQDASTRRKPLQAKIGVGVDAERFVREVGSTGGHVGLPESTAMLAAAIGWELDEITERLTPVTTDTPVRSQHFAVDPGDVIGIEQSAEGVLGGESVIRLDLEMSLGATEPHDAVAIEGTPDVEFRVDGGLHGDVTTPAVVVNATPSVRRASPGLASMLDLAVPSFSRNGSR